MKRIPLEQRTPDFQTLFNFVALQVEGAEITYTEVTQRTGVKMDAEGRRLLKQAIDENDRLAICKRSIGYVLDGVENLGQQSDDMSKKFRMAAIRHKRGHEILKGRYDERMTPDQKQIIEIRLIISTQIAEGKKKQLLPPKQQITQHPEIIPIP